jgi:anionic cell wall polymer biosynthesis LytR-Cps2A-Psr (LCP) family protein
LQRVEVQQEFLKALLEQAFSRNSIVGNLPAFAETVIKYVDTNFALSEVPKFAKFANSFKSENIKSHTLPGTPSYIGSVWYYIADEVKIAELTEALK